jgi:hypothetical protein
MIRAAARDLTISVKVKFVAHDDNRDRIDFFYPEDSVTDAGEFLKRSEGCDSVDEEETLRRVG